MLCDRCERMCANKLCMVRIPEPSKTEICPPPRPWYLCSDCIGEILAAITEHLITTNHLANSPPAESEMTGESLRKGG